MGLCHLDHVVIFKLLLLGIVNKLPNLVRCAVPNLKLLVFYLLYFKFSLRTKNKLGCPFFLDFVSGISSSRYSG